MKQYTLFSLGSCSVSTVPNMYKLVNQKGIQNKNTKWIEGGLCSQSLGIFKCKFFSQGRLLPE
jgi:hypothetical protein